MGRLFSLLRGVESSIRSRLGVWMQEVSLAGDQAKLDITQLQVDMTAPGSAYVTQTDWYVNSATGSNANDASVGAPIKTLAELERRWTGRTFSPAVTAVTINLAGTFQTEGLYLSATFTTPTDPTTVTITGTMTTIDSGSITGYVAWDSASDVRGALTDVGQNFTPHVRRRIQITSAGAAQGGITHIGSLGGGVAVANVGQFRTPGDATLSGYSGVDVNPVPGDTYIIETFDTQIAGYDFRCPGASVILQDVEVAPLPGKASFCFSHQMQGLAKVAGCDFVGAPGAGTTAQGAQMWVACAVSGTTTVFRDGLLTTKALCVFTLVSIYDALWSADSTMHDGDGGTLDVHLDLELGTTLLDNGFRAFFGCSAASSALAWVNKASYWQLSSCYLWGAAGNLTTNAVRVTNGSGVYYVTGFLPKATGIVPGNDVVLSGAAAIAWAAVPAVAAPPNNAVVALHA